MLKFVISFPYEKWGPIVLSVKHMLSREIGTHVVWETKKKTKYLVFGLGHSTELYWRPNLVIFNILREQGL